MNPIALAFWGVLTIAGYLVNDIRGALVGLMCGMALSVLVSLSGRS